jgi:hypothetical protein
LQGATYGQYQEDDPVPVVYICPVPGYSMLAFVLVLEIHRPLPRGYSENKLNELFPEKVPSEITFHKEKKMI